MIPELDNDVAAAAAGSVAAFGRLVRLHRPKLVAFLRGLTGDGSEADDLAQETLVTCWSKLPSYDARSPFLSWALGIAYRKALTARRSKRREAAKLAEAGVGWEEAADDVMEERLLIERALGRLRPDRRAAALLCFGAGLSQKEASAVLGLPLGTLKLRLRESRSELQDLLRSNPA